MNGRRRAGEIVNLVNFEKNRLGHIVPDHLETMIVHQVKNVFLSARKIIVQADNIVAFIEKPFA